VPDSKFGLHVNRSVDIKPPRTVIVNQFGKPRQLLVPFNNLDFELNRKKDFLQPVQDKISHDE
jgi:hypothetical protein